jgi:hypothetical protein
VGWGLIVLCLFFWDLCMAARMVVGMGLAFLFFLFEGLHSIGRQ